MRRLTYLAVLESTGSGYSAFIPDFPGCIGCGKDLADVQEDVQRALSLHIYGMEKDGGELPAASDLGDIENAKGNIIVPVSVFPELVKNEMDNRRVKTNVTIPSWLKDLAEANKVNYSRLLETALKEYLKIPSQGR